MLYGVTTRGGADGYGTLFRATTSGAEKVLHSFSDGSDGGVPAAGLINVGGALYGTATYGGFGGGYGTVFRSTKGGSVTPLYSFKNGSDGGVPVASLLDVKGAFYSTTFGGLVQDVLGTIFKMTPSGAETVLHVFGGGNTDGAYPRDGLTDLGGIFYGTTGGGGGTGCSYQTGCGTVFRMTSQGVESLLHVFVGPEDAFPIGGLIKVNGVLYGTTSGDEDAGGSGTVFKITPSADYNVLYTFSGSADGGGPDASLLDVGGVLYGVTSRGGSFNCNGGCGTVFKVTTAGVESVIYAFTSGNDGETPLSALIDIGGKLYGTTQKGGTASCGTIYEIEP